MTSNEKAIIFQGDLEEVDDIESLSFKSMMGMRRYLPVSFGQGMYRYLLCYIHCSSRGHNLEDIKLSLVQEVTD